MFRRTRPPVTSRRRWRGRACGSILPSPGAPTCLPRPAACWSLIDDAIDRLNEVDPDITLATLDAYAPVVPGKMIATVKIIPFAVSGSSARSRRRGGARRQAAGAGCALQDQARRHHLDLAAGPRRQGDREDAARDRRAAGAGGREDHRRATRAARGRGAREGARRNAAKPAPSSCSCSARPPSPIGATSFRPQSKRRAARSSISACRSIPAI